VPGGCPASCPASRLPARSTVSFGDCSTVSIRYGMRSHTSKLSARGLKPEAAHPAQC
jgi:hypothetical protein